MTTNETTKLIGKTATLAIDGLRFAVTILDARSVFGRADYQVAPVTGSGSKWVSSDRVTLDAQKQ